MASVRLIPHWTVTDYCWRSKVQDIEGQQNVVKVAGETFGYLPKLHDSDNTIRLKLIGLFFVQPILGIFVTMPARTLNLLSFDWAGIGYEKAKREFRELRPQNPQSKIGGLAFAAMATKWIAWELIKEIAKIVTYPLSLVASLFISLYGLIDPQRARYAFGKVNLAWCHSQFFMDYRHLCMVSKEDVDANDLYAGGPHYHKHSVRSLLLTVENQLKQERGFFQAANVAVDNRLQKISSYRAFVKRVSATEMTEVDVNGNLLKNRNEEILVARQCLIEINTCLQKIREAYQQSPVAENQVDIAKKNLNKLYKQLDRLFSPT